MAEPVLGTIFGGYRIDERIGRGGMANVYRATQLSNGRTVALKVLPESRLDDDEFVARFRREAQTVIAFDHPHIVPVYDAGDLDGDPFIAMMLVPGGTLSDRIDGPVSEENALRYVVPIAAAIDYAHKRGVVHRDIKPSNILLGHDDWVFVGDFGIARAEEGATKLTSTGMLMGTAEYVSPEQGEGKLELDSRSDIYSLGVVFFELLTGAPPFRGRTPYAVIYQHLYEPLPESMNTLSEEVQQVLRCMLAKSPSGRFATATDLRNALACLVEGLPLVLTTDDDGVRVERKTPLTPPTPMPVHADFAAQPTRRLDVPTAPRPAKHRSPVVVLTVAAILVLAILGSIFTRQQADQAVAAQAAQGTAFVQAATSTAVAVQEAEQARIQAIAATATAGPGATVTAEAQATVDTKAASNIAAQVTATFVAQRTFAVANEVYAGSRVLAGPSPVTFRHIEDGEVEFRASGLNSRDVAMEAVFINPYSADQRPFDYGFYLRDAYPTNQVRVVLVAEPGGAEVRVLKVSGGSNRFENLTCWSPPRDRAYQALDTSDEDPLPTGEETGREAFPYGIRSVVLPVGESLNRAADAGNRLRVIAHDGDLWVFLNNTLTGYCDLSSARTSGDMGTGTGFYAGNEWTGYTTRIEEFTVWTIT